MPILRALLQYEIASYEGPAADIIQKDGPCRYPFDVVKKQLGRDNFDIDTPDRTERVRRRRVSPGTSADLFTASVQFERLKRAASAKLRPSRSWRCEF